LPYPIGLGLIERCRGCWASVFCSLELKTRLRISWYRLGVFFRVSLGWLVFGIGMAVDALNIICHYVPLFAAVGSVEDLIDAPLM